MGFAIFLNHTALSETKETQHPHSNKETKKETAWDNLDMEYLGKEHIPYPMDGKPKLRVRITNIGNQTINGVTMGFQADNAMLL